jgi:L-ascorbate metabolism protein UlaG (beta-lactamase superfamily)
MEITQLSGTGFRLKTKVATVVLDTTVTVSAKGAPFVISEPGEYEVEGISIFGYGSKLGSAMYLIHAEGMRVVYVTPTAVATPEGKNEELGRVDVMVVPVAGAAQEGALDVKAIIKMIETVEPTYIVPYDAGLDVSSFVTAYEHGSKEADSLSVSAASLPTDTTEVVILKVK